MTTPPEPYEVEDDRAPASPASLATRRWGYIDEHDQFVALPMKPFDLSNLGPPPFTVQVWSGERTIVEEPCPAQP